MHLEVKENDQRMGDVRQEVVHGGNGANNINLFAGDPPLEYTVRFVIFMFSC